MTRCSVETDGGFSPLRPRPALKRRSLDSVWSQFLLEKALM